VQVDPQRLAQEVALFAERTDVAEELNATELATSFNSRHYCLGKNRPAGSSIFSYRRCTAR